MYWSRTLIPTMKETPSDAEIVSHQLLMRSGLIRKLTGGLYTFMPLGLRVLRKVERIVREEMDRAGALEVLMPALQPVDIWQKSGRYETAADVLFKVKDRAKKDWVLGPTHEEVITTLVAGEIAAAVLLLAGAGLLVRTLIALNGLDPGFRAERVLTMHVALPTSERRQWSCPTMAAGSWTARRQPSMFCRTSCAQLATISM